MEIKMTSLREILVAAILWISIGSANAALFIAAHPDDVAYLMNKNAQTDVKNNYPTVFVLLTAGDAQNGTGLANNTKNLPYYRARLKAQEQYVRFWQGLNPDIVPPFPTYSTSFLRGKSVETVRMGNVVIYNLNLPDNGSLMQLNTGRILSVTSISPRNTYRLADVKAVIREIIRINNLATPVINLNTHDPDTGWNPGDHPDHVATGAIVNAALRESPAYTCVNRLFYKGYVIGGYAQTFSDEDLDIHVATIGVLNSALIENGNTSTWDPFHNNFFGKMDFRGIMGTGECNFQPGVVAEDDTGS